MSQYFFIFNKINKLSRKEEVVSEKLNEMNGGVKNGDRAIIATPANVAFMYSHIPLVNGC